MNTVNLPSQGWHKRLRLLQERCVYNRIVIVKSRSVLSRESATHHTDCNTGHAGIIEVVVKLFFSGWEDELGHLF